MVKYLKTPISEEDIRELRAGDVVYITGTMVTGRDEAHKRAVKENAQPGIDLTGLVLYHAGPIVKDNVVLAAGPTTSKRMEAYQADFLKMHGVKLIVGKGGMGEKTSEACKTLGVCHGIYPGGCAVLAAAAVKEIKDEIWPDLGMPEAMWVMEVENFGPVIINIDTVGGNLIGDNVKKFKERASEEI